MKIILTGGGTAGHILPVILVGEKLAKNQRNNILYVGSGKVEKELVEKKNIPFKSILAGKRRAYFSFLNYLDLLKTICGIVQAFFLLLRFRPDIVFAKGGYVTVPIIFWLGFFKIPLVIHESDSVFGRANMWAAPKSKKICLGFPLKYYENLNIPLDKLIYTGIPVASDFFQIPVKSDNVKKILITGGSQGSSRINKIISEILPRLVSKYEIWHLSGERDFSELSKFKDKNYHLLSFTQDIPKLIRDVDLVISRAGANTLAEISAAQKASIIIPLPESANNHQVMNAKVYKEINAAVVVTESQITSGSLESIINNLMEDDEVRKLLGHHAKSLARQNAAEEIIDVIFGMQTNDSI